MSTNALRVLAVPALLLASFPAFAADDDDKNSGPATVGAGTADPGPKPDAPSPEIPNPAKDVRTYAGVGSDIAYGERGVGELGGSVNFTAVAGATSLAILPSAGYFIFDNVELSGILGIQSQSAGGSTSNTFSLVAEPSVWFPVNDGFFLGGGLGLGLAVVQSPVVDVSAGFDIAPRLGGKLLIGRSGILNFGLREQIVAVNADVAVSPAGGTTVVAFTNTFDVGAGYTVMF